MQTFTILGTNPELSLLEIKAVTGSKPSHSTDLVAVFDDIEDELTKLNKRLGGVQKIGHIIGSITKTSKSELVEFMSAMIIGAAPVGKITFGISIYDFGDKKRTRQFEQDKDSIGIEVKKTIKANGSPARYVTSRDSTLSAVSVTKNKMLSSGGEFVFLVGERETLVGLTSAVQDYEDWSFRDFDRPRRDAKRGMLPPKLARMMVNITGVNPEGKTLLDPFCGSGTILMEAGIIGYAKLHGTDVLEMATFDTEKNMVWLAEKGYPVPDFKLCTTKASNLSAYIKPESIDAIATEPFLGKPRQGSETFAEITAAVHELEQLYKESFSAIYETLKPGGVIVLINPVHFVTRRVNSEDFRNKNREEDSIEVPMNQIMQKIGFKLSDDYDNSILYRREGQFVGRRVMKFVK